MSKDHQKKHEVSAEELKAAKQAANGTSFGFDRKPTMPVSTTADGRKVRQADKFKEVADAGNE